MHIIQIIATGRRGDENLYQPAAYAAGLLGLVRDPKWEWA